LKRLSNTGFDSIDAVNYLFEGERYQLEAVELYPKRLEIRSIQCGIQRS